jgi:hypothetical protein
LDQDLDPQGVFKEDNLSLVLVSRHLSPQDLEPMAITLLLLLLVLGELNLRILGLERRMLEGIIVIPLIVRVHLLIQDKVLGIHLIREVFRRAS